MKSLTVFRPAWFARPLPRRVRNLYPATRGTGNLSSSLKWESAVEDGIKECKAASLAGRQRSRPLLHFSRKISLANLTKRTDVSSSGLFSDRVDNDDLPYLALCRVFLHKTCEVDGPITEVDVAFAAGSDFDSVHSSEW